MKKLFALIVILFAGNFAQANNIQVSNGTLTSQNTTEGYWLVQFDLSWENSWRTDNLFPLDGHNAGNWDAAWVFVKYRVGNGDWQHAKLHNSGHTAGTGTPATIDIGVPNEQLAFHISENPGVGAFIYRSQNGNGNFSTTGNLLRWNYGVDNIPEDELIEISIFAIEMVYVAPGPFWLGSGGTETRPFIAGGGNGPFLASESWNGCIENESGCLWGALTSGFNTVGDPGILPEHFPTGINGYYSMKYQVSQQQYVDFLNTLTPAQASTRAYTGGANRNGISFTNGQYETSTPNVANNWMSWMDGAAFLDWSGLRPMTELEYEKAARGPASPVPNEYAWGSTSIIQVNGLIDAGLAEETPTPASANANFTQSSNPVAGPVRVGSFAGQNATREASGAGYWGIMELSGNLWERPVTVGNNDGRAFSGLHGNGTLSTNGYADVPAWPGLNSGGVTGATGSGMRGGTWDIGASALAVSNRFVATDTDISRNSRYGFRGVRSLPAAIGE